MKKQVYPQDFATNIQFKDGSFINKRWLYFRSLLRLESDMASHSMWKNNKSSWNEENKIYLFNNKLLSKK